jgi:hypothetical protein
MSVFKGNIVKNEPVLIQGLVQAALALVLSFGVDISDEQIGSIMAITAVILAIIARLFVTPNDQVPPDTPSTPPEAPPGPELYPAPPPT